MPLCSIRCFQNATRLSCLISSGFGVGSSGGVCCPTQARHAQTQLKGLQQILTLMTLEKIACSPYTFHSTVNVVFKKKKHVSVGARGTLMLTSVIYSSISLHIYGGLTSSIANAPLA